MVTVPAKTGHHALSGGPEPASGSLVEVQADSGAGEGALPPAAGRQALPRLPGQGPAARLLKAELLRGAPLLAPV